MTISSSAMEACRGAEAVVIATEWKEFVGIDWEKIYESMNKPAFVFDGRLIVDAEKLTKIGFKVSGLHGWEQKLMMSTGDDDWTAGRSVVGDMIDGENGCSVNALIDESDPNLETRYLEQTRRSQPMPPTVPPPSPMALARPPPAPSIFKKKRSSQSLTLSPMASAATYLSALSEADARARGSATPPPTSTPALSMSSSTTCFSSDTVLNEFDEHPDTFYYRGNGDGSGGQGDGLLAPVNPPTSEQVFSTVHTEFGHCANESYRYTSKHSPPDAPLPLHVEQDPPYYVLFSTYISYLILIILGHVRDFVGKRLSPSSYRHLIPSDVSVFLGLLRGFRLLALGVLPSFIVCIVLTILS